MSQAFSFSFANCLITEVGHVGMDQLHSDVDAIFHAYESVKPLAARLGVPAPMPCLGGFGYTSIAALGAEIEFGDNAEPKPLPLIQHPEEIDTLIEPQDYLAAPFIRNRLRLNEEIRKRSPQSPQHIGHFVQGPITMAVMIMGPGFFMLPYDDPQRAHRLLKFTTRCALGFNKAITDCFGVEQQPGPRGMPDDFAGMFSPELFTEYVAPYWEELYTARQATQRSLHSELLRKEHLPFLKQLKIDFYDCGVDQYLTPVLLEKECPCAYQCVIQSWHIRDLSAAALEKMYLEITTHHPAMITFSMEELKAEGKITRLLKVARAMAK